MLPDNTHLDIVTTLSLDQVKQRLRKVILEPEERQTQYYQQFVGHIEQQDARFRKIRSGEDPTFYTMIFGTMDNQTLVSISNDVYDRRLIAYSMVKTILIPFGFIILILGFVFYRSWFQLLITIGVSATIITLSILFKVKPLSREEYLNDYCVRKIIKIINGQAL